MRHIATFPAALAGLTLAACGGSSASPVPSELAGVCTQDASPTGAIEVSAPDAGMSIQSPLKVSGKVNSPGSRFFTSVVKGDGTHIIDYPGQTAKGGGLAPFDQQVPFSIFETTPACLWVYIDNVAEPRESIRIPIVLEPSATTTTTQGGS
jgi:hypothetical protein